MGASPQASDGRIRFHTIYQTDPPPGEPRAAGFPLQADLRGNDSCAGHP